MFERKTVIGNHVTAIFKKAQAPLSVQDILSHLAKLNLTPNKTTIYRMLEKLVAKNTLTEIAIKQGGSVYELSPKTHHHHFICNSCSHVYCLKSCHVDTHQIDLSGLLPNNKFRIQSHDFNLYGTCDACNKGKP